MFVKICFAGKLSVNNSQFSLYLVHLGGDFIAVSVYLLCNDTRIFLQYSSVEAWNQVFMVSRSAALELLNKYAVKDL